MKCQFNYLNWVFLIKNYLKKDFFSKKNLLEKSVKILNSSSLTSFKTKNHNFLRKLNLYEINDRLTIDFPVGKTLIKAFFKKKTKRLSLSQIFNSDYSGNNDRPFLTSSKSHNENFHSLSSLHMTKGDMLYLLGKEERNEIDNILRNEIVKLIPLKSTQIKKQINFKNNLKTKNISHTGIKEIDYLGFDKFFNKKLLIDINRALGILEDLFL